MCCQKMYDSKAFKGSYDDVIVATKSKNVIWKRLAKY